MLIEYSEMKDPLVFLDTVIKDTESNKLLWASKEIDRFTIRYVAIIDIPRTKKFLTLTLNDLLITPEFNFLSTTFHMSKKNITFYGLNAKEYIRIKELLNSIKKQLKN